MGGRPRHAPSPPRGPRARLTAALLPVLMAALGMAGLTACTPKPRVLVFGDSITLESRTSGDAATILKDYAVDWSGARFMTAPCNGIATSKTIGYTPDVVVINYAGNRGSLVDNCMANETGTALAARYLADVQTLIDTYRNGKTRIVIVGAPARLPTLADSNLVFTTLKGLAADPKNGVAFFDGGRYLTPHRTEPGRTAICLGVETGLRCGTAGTAGHNIIRDDRIEHLCPAGGSIDGGCPVYSSGAIRLSYNLLDAIKAATVAVR